MFSKGFVLDADNGVCYTILTTSMDYDDASTTGCSHLDAELLTFENDNQTKGLLNAFNQG
jgi:hypothetical protein